MTFCYWFVFLCELQKKSKEPPLLQQGQYCWKQKKGSKVILNLCGENKINPMHHTWGHAGGSEIITPPPLDQYFNVFEMESNFNDRRNFMKMHIRFIQKNSSDCGRFLGLNKKFFSMLMDCMRTESPIKPKYMYTIHVFSKHFLG